MLVIIVFSSRKTNHMVLKSTTCIDSLSTCSRLIVLPEQLREVLMWDGVHIWGGVGLEGWVGCWVFEVENRVF
jgi:hypothetical protein